MCKEKTFTAVGTAINPDGTMKVRWTNDIIWRIDTLIKAKCTEIEMHALPKPMTKLEAIIWLEKNVDLAPFQLELVSFKINEKTKMANRNKVKERLTREVEKNVEKNTPIDPRISQMVEGSTKLQTSAVS